MSLAPGTRLGPYEIVSALGRGGMGEVYKGIDRRLDRNVAIKVVAESLSADPQYRKRLEREARSISRLQHPNICTLYDVGIANGSQYLVMELLEGQTLQQLLAQGPIAPDRVLEYGRQIAEGIAAAHSGGIVHRDLKPGNVMVGATGIKVLDFGLARSVLPVSHGSETVTLQETQESLSADGALVGTLPYMAPEQLEGKRPDRRTDIWALGCILYEMTVGSRPFQSSSRAGLIGAIMSSTPEPVKRVQPLAPDLLDTIVTKCLAKDPAQRFQTATELADALDAATQVPASKVEPARTKRGSSPMVAGVVLALVAAVVGYVQLRPDASRRIVSEGRAVAVLPFENLTGDDQFSYVGPGVAAEVTAQLAKLPGLTVVGRSRSWEAQRKHTAPSAIAESLGVSFLVEGEFHRAPSGLALDMAIVDGVSSSVLWSEKFEAAPDELFALHQQVSRSIARVLSVPLSTEDLGRLSRPGPSSRAFHYYLQGIERLEQRANPRHFEFAADLFRQAIRIEGDVAAFHAALSFALSQQYLEGVQGAAAVDPDAEIEARKALELDPELSDGYLALARAFRAQGKHAEAIAELRPIVDRHPKPDELFLELSFAYELAGDAEAAFQALETAVALNPSSWLNWNALGVAQSRRGDVELAMESLERALALAPESVVWPRLNRGGVKLLVGDYTGAIEDFEATGATTSDPDVASNFGTAHFFLGHFDRAEAMYRRAIELNPDSHLFRRNLGDVFLAQKREPEAIEAYLEALRLVEAALVERPRNAEFLRSRALYSAKAHRCEAAIEQVQSALPFLGPSWQDQLEVAMTFQLCGRTQPALAAVKACVESGLPIEVIRDQAELVSLVGTPGFEAIASGTD